MSKIVKLFDNSPTPEELLKDLTEIQGELKNVMVVYERNDNSIDVAHSYLTGKDILFLTKVLELYTNSYVNEELEDSKEES